MTINTVNDRLGKADAALMSWAKSITLGTLKLQFIGLLLAATGTILLCIAGVVA